ncbi:MAG TPA: flagellar biosynthesis protein FlhB, partial [Clostridiales bacterium]|nr:flagellar biosynthesis protein FlhB [Clostridiales bacterium]
MKSESYIKIESYIINLQLFADEEEKTEPATPKKRQDVRKKGLVAKSNEVNSVIILILGFLALRLFTGYMVGEIFGFSRLMFSSNGVDNTLFTVDGIYKLSRNVAITTVKICIPIFLAVMLGGLTANYMQVGFLFSLKPIMPNLNRINPIEGAKRLFSKRALMELAKSLGKIAIIIYVAYSELRKQFETVPSLLELDLRSSVIIVGQTIFMVAMKISMVLVAIAALDYFFQRRDYEKNISMTKYELKQELKQTEGDPLVRGKIKDKQREMARRRMMQDVPKADVVITNPVHYAVALKYDQDKNDAPVVVAKGQGYIALKIKEMAASNGVHIVENKPLARSLYSMVAIGQEIPE